MKAARTKRLIEKLLEKTDAMESQLEKTECLETRQSIEKEIEKIHNKVLQLQMDLELLPEDEDEEK